MIPTFFHHIPKTGGTSFMEQASSFVGATNWYTYDQYGEIPSGYENRILLASHAAAASVEGYVGDRFEFTILRDPVDRVISWVNFEQDKRRVLPLLRDVEMYAHNRMVRQLGGCLHQAPGQKELDKAKERLDGMDFVGFTETWTEDQAALYDLLDLPLNARVWNTSSGECDFTQEAIEYVHEITQWDRRLYEWAKETRGQSR